MKPPESIVKVRPFEADLGAAKAIGSLFITDPIEDSFIRGTLKVLGLEDVPFQVRVDGPPLQINVLDVTVIISFDPVLRAFTGCVARVGAGQQPPTSIVGLD